MRFIGAVVAVVATFSICSGAQAQTIASVGGPRELPPASYTGQQYVDSRGCVFLRAGYGGQINWVPRVSSQRKALCGFPPTFGKKKIEVAQEAPATRVVVQAPAAPAPQMRAQAVDPAIYTPAPYTPTNATQSARRIVQTAPSTLPQAVTIATTRAAAPAPYSQTAPRRTYEAAPSGPGPGKIGCYTSAPVAEVVRLRNGGTAVVCTKGDGGLSGWRPPIYPAGSPVGVALTDPVIQAPAARAGNDPVRMANGVTTATTTRVAIGTIPQPPKGYKQAWTDDRLNPQRGQGTASGQAAQDQIWTRDVPAKLVADQPRSKARVTVSTKSTPSQPAAQKPSTQATTRAALVQIGTFGVASNADGAASRLAALGLPVAKGQTTKGGKTLQIVFAGPFASTTEALEALSAVRRAGFSDAFVR
jgi:hypothetical protein